VLLNAMLVLSEQDIEGLVRPSEVIETAIEAYRLHAAGHVPPPVRADLVREEPKAGCLTLAGVLGSNLLVKSNVHAYPGGPAAPRLWGGTLALWDLEKARLRALISGRVFHDHRTAAGYAAAAIALARSEARTLAVFGAGKTAPMTLRYLKIARPSLTRAIIVGRSHERVEAVAKLASSWPEFRGVEIDVRSSPRAAVENADLIATVTNSAMPVFPGEAVKPGALVILGGANRATAREGDDDLMRRARVIVDARHGATDKAGDLALALKSGALVADRIVAEIGACFERPPPDAPGMDLTVFKSMGLAVQDAVLAARLVEMAERTGVGVSVDLEGAAADAV
jgi:ornithine cyclodeaminase/alanine dehydrogenase-like protein (mu-crystallin family)